MPKVTIELPAEVSFTRGGIGYTMPLGNLPAQIISQLVLHGVIQKVGDAAAGKQGREARDAMDAVAAALADGTWGRVRSSGVDPIAREIGRILLAKLPKDHAIHALEGGEQEEALQALFAKQTDAAQAVLTEAAERRIAAREEERKMRAKLKAETAGVELSF